MSRTVISLTQAADLLGKTPAALRNGYKRWGVPHFRLGGQIKFTRESLDTWVAQLENLGSSNVPQDGRSHNGERIRTGGRPRKTTA